MVSNVSVIEKTGSLLYGVHFVHTKNINTYVLKYIILIHFSDVRKTEIQAKRNVALQELIDFTSTQKHTIKILKSI